jgi:voltage-gated potassium channel
MTVGRRVRRCLLVAVLIVAAGTAGFVLIEGYSPLDAVYMTVITITTVGFREMHAPSAAGQVFTIVLIVAGFGTLGFIAHTIVDALVDAVATGTSEKRKMNKRIALLESHYIICGSGRVGSAAAEHFQRAGVDFVIVESHAAALEAARARGWLVIEGDAASEDILLQARIEHANGVLAILPSDPENLFIALTARDLNPNVHIVARADEPSSEKKLLRAGADGVVSPFSTAGTRIATEILAATGELTEAASPTEQDKPTPQWIVIQDGSSMEGQTVGQIADETDHHVLGLRRHGRDVLLPSRDETLRCGDALLMVGEPRNGDDWAKLQARPHWVAVVDDNPVAAQQIAKRLRRAGLVPLVAGDGRRGLDTIVGETPDAAVINAKLPVVSGIELCSQVRAVGSCSRVKLIVFSSDESPETKQHALEAGADAFVHKATESSELVETVVHLLHQKTAPARTAGEAPLDPDAVVAMFGGDLDKFSTVVPLFLDGYPTLLNEMREAIERRDAPALQQAAQRLRGSAEELAAHPSFEAAAQLESMAREGQLDHAGQALEALQEELDHIRPALGALNPPQVSRQASCSDTASG